MSLVLNKCFSNYKTYFVYNTEEIESCQKHRFNEAKIAASRDTVEQNENFVVDE